MVGIVALLQCTDRTVGHTLAAIGAEGLRKAVRLCRTDGRPGAGANPIPDMHALHLVAHLHAAHALDAAVFKAQNGRGVVDRRRTQLFLIGRAEQIIVVGELLQLAVATARTLDAVYLVLAEKKLQIDAARHAHLLRVRVDDHARMHLVVARGDKRFLSLDLDHADAAGTDLVEILEIAERRDVDIGRARGVQNAGSLWHADGFAVDRECYHLSILPPLKMP